MPGAGAREDGLKYFWEIFSLGDLSRLEIMEPTGKGSFLDNFLSTKKDGGVHHMTLETPDIQKFKKHLEYHGIPYFGYAEIGDIWKELFIHPKDAFGLLIQVAQMSDPNDYLPDPIRHKSGKRWAVEKTGNDIALTLAHPGGGKVRFDMNPEEIEELIADLKKTV